MTLFASGDSETSARLVAASPLPLWRDPEVRDTLPHHVHLMELVFRELARFDVVHFHCDYIHFSLVRRHRCPSVTTLHGMMHPRDLEALFDEYRDIPLVSISNDQRSPIPNANWQGTVYHGLPRDLFTFHAGPGTYLAFLGRTSREKRLDRAIQIAVESGVPLKVAAKIYPEEQVYFDQRIAPLPRQAGSLVEFVGEITDQGRNELLGNASALLFPIDWPEPFGLVMIEALACGTPVIAWRRGSVPEVLEHGVTGYIVDNIVDAVDAVGRIGSLRRSACREAFERRFDARRMAIDYVKVYERVIENTRAAGLHNGAASIAP